MLTNFSVCFPIVLVYKFHVLQRKLLFLQCDGTFLQRHRHFLQRKPHFIQPTLSLPQKHPSATAGGANYGLSPLFIFEEKCLNGAVRYALEPLLLEFSNILENIKIPAERLCAQAGI